MNERYQQIFRKHVIGNLRSFSQQNPYRGTTWTRTHWKRRICYCTTLTRNQTFPLPKPNIWCAARKTENISFFSAVLIKFKSSCNFFLIYCPNIVNPNHIKVLCEPTHHIFKLDGHPYKYGKPRTNMLNLAYLRDLDRVRLASRLRSVSACQFRLMD